MNKAKQAKESVIDLLIKSGFIPDGDTRTSLSPSSDYMRKTDDKQSKEWASASGRLRFLKVGTNIKATVGDRTTAIYRVERAGLKGVKGIGTFDTVNISEILSAVKGLN